MRFASATHMSLTVSTLTILFFQALFDAPPTQEDRLKPGLQHQCPTIYVYFSPRGGCTNAIVDAIECACDSILVRAYSFTSPAISAALIRAQSRGVKVEALLDEDSNRDPARSMGDDLAAGGAAVLYDGVHAIAHDKTIVIDDDVVITGSFNFSVAAEQSNSENLLVIYDATLAAKYRENFARHKAHGRPLVANSE